MDTKGPTLIAAAFGLIIAGAVFVQLDKETTTSGAIAVAEPNELPADTASTAASDNTSPEALTNPAAVTRDATWTRRTTSGGALFISAGDTD
ncbi:MAG: hypothetical protein GY945_13950 [Rhodobacteraceae bacterium]|nr:hypothetical protein [Paracoccaceae bacterium]